MRHMVFVTLWNCEETDDSAQPSFVHGSELCCFLVCLQVTISRHQQVYLYWSLLNDGFTSGKEIPEVLAPLIDAGSVPSSTCGWVNSSLPLLPVFSYQFSAFRFGDDSFKHLLGLIVLDHPILNHAQRSTRTQAWHVLLLGSIPFSIRLGRLLIQPYALREDLVRHTQCHLQRPTYIALPVYSS